MKRHYALAAATGLAAALTVFPVLAADSLPTETHKVLTAALAVEAAEAAIAHCKAEGYNVSVTIMDRTGVPKLILMGDGASELSMEIARRKAYTAAMLKVPTGDFAKRLQQPGAFNPGVFDPQLTPAQGGLPIKVGNDTIAAIGASGAPGGDKDEACAAAGLAKISDRLN
ncbi:MAG TPA: heme-binding protein [Stellaceae bacterium]|nr:heme-binding protein [Stellaceae bacterium]